MAGPSELPDLVREFVDLSKQYLQQETVEPARRLGKYAGFSIGAGFAFGFAALFLGIAVARLFIKILPEGPYWESLGYVLAILVLGGVAGLLVRAGSTASEGT